MKYYLTCLLFVCSVKVLCQPPVDPLIRKVENGLGKQTVLQADAPINTQNIYDVLKTQHVNGVSVAVINNGRIEWTKAYGVVDKSNGDSVNIETLFQCASIGKMITAMVALHLVKEGKLTLDEDVNNKLTSWKVEENEFTREQKVTLRRLLSHSAGFADDYGFAGYSPGSALPSLLQILNNKPPANNKKRLTVQTVPGTTERYSGGGYLIVQQLIEDLTHQSFSSYVKEIIFDKLGMNNTTYGYYPDSTGKPVARGHDKKGNVDGKRRYHLYPEMAAAGPWTTATDLARLVIQLQKEYRGLSALIVNQELCREMLTPQINFKGLGVHLTGAEGPEAFWHAGNNEGFTALLYGTVHTGQGAVVLTNSDGGEEAVLQMITSIATVYDWPVMKFYRAEKLSSEEVQRYKGRYQTAKGAIVEIAEDKQGLALLTALSKRALPVYKIGKGTFTLKESPDFVRLFFTIDDGKISTLTIIQKLGQASKLKRIE